MTEPTVSEHIEKLKNALNELHQFSSRPPGQRANPLPVAVMAFEAIPPEVQQVVLPKAIGKGIRRFRAAATMLAACEPSACVDSWITTALNDSDSQRQDWMIQIVGNRKLKRFSPIIAQLIESEGERRWWAVQAAGELQTDDCLQALISLANNCGEPIPISLIISLSRFRSNLVAPILQPVFDSPPDNRHLVFAAWGLARLGDQAALNCLVDLLDDPDERDEAHFHPGESLRAAQALCDLHDWPFEWNKAHVQKTKARARVITDG